MTIESISHEIDLVRWLAGEVKGAYGKVASSRPDLPGFDDNLSATLTLETGVIANIHASWSSHIPSVSRGLSGKEGTAAVEGPDLWTWCRLRRRGSGDKDEVIEEFPREIAEDWSFAEECEAFARAVSDGTPPISSGVDGLRALEVSHAILKSVDTGNEVFPQDM